MASSILEPQRAIQFHEMGLDNRLLKAIANLGWAEPTLIQEKAIPLALDGKDILSRARTGSGKTAAYAIPVIQKILQNKKGSTVTDDKEHNTNALILVPSRELSGQATKMIRSLTEFCSRDINCVDVSVEADPKLLRPMLANRSDIVIGTPSRILCQINAGNMKVSDSMQWLVIDEADILFSFGYQDDLKSLLSYFPNNYQAFIMSATFNEDLEALKKLILHNPVTLNLNESQLPMNDQLTQYHVLCNTEDDKYLLIYALIKLKLINGKSLLFVNSINTSYRLKLFLEQFSVFCCVLNSELPVNTRCHVVKQYNQGLYDLIIATDESSLIPTTSSSAMGEKVKQTGKRKKKKVAKAKEYGVSRGIDFQNITNVINFDFPTSVESYIHRVGRTARGDKTGTALSFVVSEEIAILKKAQDQLSNQGGDDSPLKPYQFKMDEIEGFRYRCKDAIRTVTKVAIREARIKEVRLEMLNSDKLKTYFEENPNDLSVLRHDAISRPMKVKRHMKNVPDYLIPPTLKGMYTGRTVQKRPRNVPRNTDNKQVKSGRLNPKYKKQRENPLLSFKYVK